MISERMLRKWRFEALKTIASEEAIRGVYKEATGLVSFYVGAQKVVLALTQELLDQRLLEKGGVK
uniref:Uncharacterized protein n=1 Tax=viral metagenome TaxID=1070528 RepID=A0A6M3KAG4_9ZZZZ